MDDNIEFKLCNGCLCNGRRLTYLNDFWKKQCYLSILNEIPMNLPEDANIWLCWECEALINRFTRFKQQIKNSQRVLQEYSKKNLNISQLNALSPNPRLQIHFADAQNITFGGVDATEIKCETDEWWDDKKAEVEICDTLKLEDVAASISDHNYSDSETKFTDIPKENIKKKKKKLSSMKKKKLEKYKIVELSDEDIAEERKHLALNESYVDSLFKCERCIIPFPNSDYLEDHIAKKHDSNIKGHKCKICECAFANEMSFSYHKSKHVRRYQCILCTERFSSKSNALKHYHVTHDIMEQYECSVCQLLFSTESTYYNHRRSHHINADDKHIPDDTDACIYEQKSSDTFPCDFCTKTFRWKTSLRKHVELHRIESGEQRTPYCEPCRLSFTTTSNLQKHVKTSSKHQIQLKLRKLKDAQKVTKIQEIKDDINKALNKFPCSHCDKKFQWKGNLLRHIQSHKAQANGELVCAPCNKKFSSIATYQQHMKLSKKHVSESDFKYTCKNCGKKFSNKTRLTDHIDWEHLKNYVHKCASCQKVFKSHTSLYLHKQVVHQRDDVEHLCDHCGKSFPTRAKLRSHITAMHTTEQPYKCKLCNASFSWHSCLSRHVKVVHHKQKVKKKRKKDEFILPNIIE